MNRSLLPNLLVVGAQKAGTTSLYDILKQHPDFYLPHKEIKYFHRDEHFQKGIEWYANHFEGYSGQKYIGDFTPDYMAYNWTAERIYNQLGSEIKIVFLLRHPVQRAYSQYNFYRMHGVEKNSDFIETISKEKIDLDQGTFENWHTPANYISRSIYTPQIKRFLDFYDEKNIHIAIFEELFIQKDKDSLKQMEAFLETTIHHLFEMSTKSNSSQLPKNKAFIEKIERFKKLLRPFKRVINTLKLSALIEQSQKQLYKKPDKLDKNLVSQLTHQYFQEDITALEKLLGREIKVWKTNA